LGVAQTFHFLSGFEIKFWRDYFGLTEEF
jgi:hypothetical protein